MSKIRFLNQLLLRTPLKMVETDITLDKIDRVLKEPLIKDALFLASPEFYNLLNKGVTERQFYTLYKYYSRFSNRCTPFGLFATVSIIRQANKTCLEMANAKLHKKARYDMMFLGAVTEKINQNPNLRNALIYFPNNSIYQFLNNFRYVEFYYSKNRRYHKLSEVTYNKYLEKIINKAQNGAKIQDLQQLLFENSIPYKESKEFINTLIDAQFLVSELDMNLSGPDYLETIIELIEKRCREIGIKCEISNLLHNLKERLFAICYSSNISTNCMDLFEDLKKTSFTKDANINRLFQIDATRKINQGTLDKLLVDRITLAVKVLNKLSRKYKNERIERFKREFTERFGNELLPLCHVLDPDLGINYLEITRATTKLLQQVPLQNINTESKSINFNKVDEFLLKKIIQSNKDNLYVIQLNLGELKSFEESMELYPDTFSVIFSTLQTDGKSKIEIKGVSGPSANNLIGRFGYLDHDILEISKKISGLESTIHKDKILAEIIHLPEARTGNILHRKFQRNYEIPYLAKSSLNLENQILITDLYVSVKNDEIILFSKKHNKVVLPRLGNAHNYSFQALPIYNFLCDIQNQKSMGFSFDWGTLQTAFTFLPRLEYKDCILSKAQWNLYKKDYEHLFSNKLELNEEIKKFRTSYKIPLLVLLIEGDNEVLINFSNSLSVKVFLSMIKHKNRITLQEYIEPDSKITNGYANEFIAFGSIERPNTPTFSVDLKKSTQVNYNQKWLYFKVYCGPLIAEEVLKNCLSPLLKERFRLDKNTKWFFVKFNDTYGHHLRIRIQVENSVLARTIHEQFDEFIRPYTVSKAVWRIQTDSYLPEYERYGAKIIKETEIAFNNDSCCILGFLNLIGDEGNEKSRWLFILLSIDHYLNDFKMDNSSKKHLMNSLKEGYGNEFKKGKSINKKINSFFREHEKEIFDILNTANENSTLTPFLELVQNRSQRNLEIFKPINEYLQAHPKKANEIIGSHIHMVCNRAFTTKQREQEAIIYDLLFQYYRKSEYINGV